MFLKRFAWSVRSCLTVLSAPIAHPPAPWPPARRTLPSKRKPPPPLAAIGPDWYSCNPTACLAPDCMCPDDNPPGGLTPAQTPMFVLVRLLGHCCCLVVGSIATAWLESAPVVGACTSPPPLRARWLPCRPLAVVACWPPGLPHPHDTAHLLVVVQIMCSSSTTMR